MIANFMAFDQGCQNIVFLRFFFVSSKNENQIMKIE